MGRKSALKLAREGRQIVRQLLDKKQNIDGAIADPRHVISPLIVKLGHPALRQKCEPIANVRTPETKALAEKILEAAHNSPALGVSAPQVGENAQMFVMAREGEELSPEPVKNFDVIINPLILKKSKQQSTDYESCLSIPGIFGHVQRSDKIMVKYTDIDGKEHEKILSKHLARIFQHEYDHLHGVVFMDRVQDTRTYFYKDFEYYAEEEEEPLPFDMDLIHQDAQQFLDHLAREEQEQSKKP